MASSRLSAAYDRVVERRRAVALARHFREAEGLSIAQIAERLGRSPSTVKAYFYDPTGEKARAVKARYVGVCRGCGAYTQPRNGKGDTLQRCWTLKRVYEARGEVGSIGTADTAWYDWVADGSGRVRGLRASRRGRGGQRSS